MFACRLSHSKDPKTWKVREKTLNNIKWNVYRTMCEWIRIVSVLARLCVGAEFIRRKSTTETPAHYMLIQNGNKFEIKMLAHGFLCRTQQTYAIHSFVSFHSWHRESACVQLPFRPCIHHTNDEIQNALKICFTILCFAAISFESPLNIALQDE